MNFDPVIFTLYLILYMVEYLLMCYDLDWYYFHCYYLYFHQILNLV